MSFPVENIREACKDKGTTIAEVERALRIGNGVIAKWEFGKRTPPVDRINAIADYLNVSPEQLIYGKQKTTPKGDGFAKDEEDEKRLLVNDDEELTEILQRAKDDPHIRMLFSVTKNATPEDIEKAIKIIQALKGD